MGSPPGFDATLSAIDAASGTLNATHTLVENIGVAASNGATIASGGAGEGPLAGVLGDLGTDATDRTKGVADECITLSRALHDTVGEYRTSDADAQTGMNALSFGNVTG